MTITDPPITNDRWKDRVDAARADWQRKQDDANTALEALTAALFDRPAPTDPQLQRFATSLESGDHVQFDDGWWHVDQVALDDPRGDVVLTLHRVGRLPLELPLPGNTLLVSVRPEIGL
jgi:hypothetical protein